jgi:hypothetical protein
MTKTILALIALAIAAPTAALGAAASQPPIVGVWRSTDDARSSVEVKADGTWIDRYQGDASATTKSHWRVFSGAHPPKDAADQTLDPKSTYLEVNDASGEPLFYGLDQVSAKFLELTYLSRGNTLTYRRMNPPHLAAATHSRP